MTVFVKHMREQLVDLFEMIEKERMSGVPVLNKRLSVDAVGFDLHDDFHLGVLLTPWFMNLVMVPTDEETSILEGKDVGSKQSHSLPGGRFEFIVGYENEIGRYLSCSLFSPVFEFTDQQTAMQTAQGILKRVLTTADPVAANDENADMRELSRREVLRGLRKTKAPEDESISEYRP